MKNKPEAVETEAEELLFYSDKERDHSFRCLHNRKRF